VVELLYFFKVLPIKLKPDRLKHQLAWQKAVLIFIPAAKSKKN
jgi:hypothetical protein